MTKRFVHIEHKGEDYILDSPNWDLDFIEMLGDSLEQKELGGLLNHFHQENNYLSTIRENQQQMILKLKEENEQLRKELEKLKLLNESLGLFMNE